MLTGPANPRTANGRLTSALPMNWFNSSGPASNSSLLGGTEGAERHVQRVADGEGEAVVAVLCADVVGPLVGHAAHAGGARRVGDRGLDHRQKPKRIDLRPVARIERPAKEPRAVGRPVLHAIDRLDWPAVRQSFADRVTVDYRSLNGEPAAEVKAEDLIAGWRALLPGFDATQHLLGPVVVSLRRRRPRRRTRPRLSPCRRRRGRCHLDGRGPLLGSAGRTGRPVADPRADTHGVLPGGQSCAAECRDSTGDLLAASAAAVTRQFGCDRPWSLNEFWQFCPAAVGARLWRVNLSSARDSSVPERSPASPKRSRKTASRLPASRVAVPSRGSQAAGHAG